MWLSEELARRTRRSGTEAESGVVTVEGDGAGVFTLGEVRGASVVAPGGYFWRPRQGETVLLVRSGTPGEAPRVLGAEEPVGETLEAGEVCIRSAGGARIVLRNNGNIELTGALTLNGVPLDGGAE